MVRWALVLSLALASTPSLAGAQSAPCRLDDALSRTAQRLLERGGPVTPQRLLIAARSEGATAPVVRAVTIEPGQDRRLSRWLRTQRRAADAPLICGEARDASRRLVLAATAAATLRLGEHGVVAELTSGFRAPQLIVRVNDGEVLRVPATAAELARGVPLPAEVSSGPALLQLVAEGPVGPRPVAELVINGTPEDVLARRAGGDDIEARITALRARRDASSLRSNRLLDREAERQAEAVCESGRVTHQRDGDDPETRLRREGIHARAVGETVARGASAASAMDALEGSPSHLSTLVDRRFTDVGLGTSEDEAGRTCLVVLLSSWPRFLGR